MAFAWNVMEEKEFKQRIQEVFNKVSETLSRSLGPYGATTLIEQTGEYHFTKDGWAILKRINFSTPFEQNILSLLTDICIQVVVKVGDGSTSSIVAANNLLEKLQSSEELKRVRPKDLLDLLGACITNITNEIATKAKRVDTYTYNDIYRLAKISTNGDEHIAAMIQDIYKNTQNPSIEFLKGTSHETTYEVIEGYRGEVTYLDTIYATNDKGESHVQRPVLLFIDHDLNAEDHGFIIQIAKSVAQNEGRKLVVIAPRFDRLMLDAIRNEAIREHSLNGTISVTYCRASLVNKAQLTQYYDMAIMAGATVFNHALVQQFLDTMKADNEESQAKVTQESVDLIANSVGRVDKAVIGKRYTTISGFTNRNEHSYQAVLKDAKAKVEELTERNRSMNVVNGDLYKEQNRLSKLQGKMGVIYVGGSSSLSRNANFDLVEDAVKSCESAMTHGYNLGGNLVIPIVIDEYLEAHANEITAEETTILTLIAEAFKNVLFTVLHNAYPLDEDTTRYEEIFAKAKETGLCFDLVTQEYNSEVINSTEADIEILKAAGSIVGLILSSNQYLSIHPDKVMVD